MGPRPSLVSVVIPTLNGAETLSEVLGALRSQEASFAIEILALDSGSRDASLQILERHSVRLHRIPPHEFNHGETRNLGMRLAKGDPVVLLTQDAIPADRHLIARLVEPFGDPRVAGVYGRQIPRPDCDVVTRRNLQRWLTGRTEPALAELAGKPLSARTAMEQLELCTFDNVCSALRRSAWEKVPFPRSDFGEDIEWGRSILLDGWAIAYAPEAAVVHSHRRSLRYEYQRTRISHRRLNELFGLAAVPSHRHVLRATVANLRSDIPHVLRHAAPGVERLRQLARVVALAALGPLAQYHGLRHARRAAGEPTKR